MIVRNKQKKHERLARDKYSTLLWKGVTYGRKKFYNTGLYRMQQLRSVIGDFKIPEVKNVTRTL